MQDKDWELPEITPQTIAEFSQKHSPNHCNRLLSVLGKNKAFYNAVSSEIGQELLKDIVFKMEYLIERQIYETETDPAKAAIERADYRCYKELLDKWSSRISNYIEKTNKLKRG